MRASIKRVAFVGILIAGICQSAMAQDQKWPSRAINITGGFPNGAGTDIYARKLGEGLTAMFNVPVVVDSKTGAGGNIASDAVARSAPDGYNYLFGTAGTHAINVALYKKLNFDVEKDFTRIALLGDVPNVLLINSKKHPDIKNCADLLKMARAKPGTMNYASTGNGASGHLAGVQFANAAKINVVHVPYRGQGPAMAALLAGDVDFFFNQSAAAINAVKGGQATAIAVTTPQPIVALPGVPTVAAGCNLPGFESSTWYGLFAPAGVPADIAKKMSDAVVKIISEPSFKQWLTDTQGITPAADSSPEAFARIHRADIKKWADIVKMSGAQVD
ncbi:tripartite tricarboxylate transporter substrate binding protein [Orrella sp. NBD-18]|uniref:Tripartite tricarboxylate transporter substrate binding protein n=1 Tax=Sheuella amnicola TaxID=2707330 RepID=A0A6B2R2U1_9BURK|nr:tripartite tricarboxylate transporter substrate-binding protein [Sheuella amnicola]NDY81755.1 tripartite tricarboxylate transporter substrate binding protein [Sheuella amnicola]HBI84614.1 tripartite tricarboxylate transporter substrate binding protein [Alcaligenaceae bacterium]